jgi:hypothetical protein
MSNEQMEIFRVPGARVATEIKEGLAQMKMTFDRKEVPAQNVSRETRRRRNG